MPIYEYRCKKCEHELEIMQKIADEPLLACPQCGQNSLEKLISRSSFRLKGGGWYESGYSTAKPENTASSSESNSSTEAATKTESNSAKSSAKTTVDTPSSTSPAKSTGEN